MKLNAGFGSRCLLVAAGLLISSVAFQTTAPAADGSDVFKKNCVMCHGADGKGYAALKTPNFTDPKFQASIKNTEMKEVIKNGKKGTQMPAFGSKLSDEDISAVITYVRSLKKK